jgi:hypothetical protein
MIDLNCWNLTLPEGSPAMLVSTAQLTQGFQNIYFKPDGSAIVFWAPVTGSHTSNSSYPRSELRETRTDGSLMNWDYPSGHNLLRAALSVNQVPSSGHIVIGQVHVKDSLWPMLKLEYHYENNQGRLVASVRHRPDDPKPDNITIATGVPLDQRFTYSIHLSPGGHLSVNGAGYHWVDSIDPSWANRLLYFKAGVYTQDNTGYANEGGRATFYRLETLHLTPDKETAAMAAESE